jgi:hypothetical protein
MEIATYYFTIGALVGATVASVVTARVLAELGRRRTAAERERVIEHVAPMVLGYFTSHASGWTSAAMLLAAIETYSHFHRRETMEAICEQLRRLEASGDVTARTGDPLGFMHSISPMEFQPTPQFRARLEARAAEQCAAAKERIHVRLFGPDIRRPVALALLLAGGLSGCGHCATPGGPVVPCLGNLCGEHGVCAPGYPPAP